MRLLLSSFFVCHQLYIYTSSPRRRGPSPDFIKSFIPILINNIPLSNISMPPFEKRWNQNNNPRENVLQVSFIQEVSLKLFVLIIMRTRQTVRSATFLNSLTCYVHFLRLVGTIILSSLRRQGSREYYV